MASLPLWVWCCTRTQLILCNSDELLAGEKEGFCDITNSNVVLT